MKRIIFGYALSIISITLFSCVTETEIDKKENTGKVPLKIMVSGSGTTETRGIPVTTADIEGSFKLYGYKTTGDNKAFDDWSTHGIIATLDDAPSDNPRQVTSLSGGPYYWPAENLNFYAIYPINWAKATGGATESGGTLKITPEMHTVPLNMLAQNDYLYAYNDGNHKRTVELVFKHALTRVTFQGQIINNGSSGSELITNAKITEIKINKTIKTGTFSFSNATNGTWVYTNEASNKQTVSASNLDYGFSGAASESEFIGSFFLIPTGGIPDVTFDVSAQWNNGNDVTVDLTNLPLPLNSSGSHETWTIGKWVNYIIQIDAAKGQISIPSVTVENWDKIDGGTIEINP